MAAKANDATPTGWCAPTIIYLVLAGIGILINTLHVVSCENDDLHVNGHRICSKTAGTWITVGLGVLITALFATLLYYLCANGHSGWAWFALIAKTLLVPLLMVVIAIALVAHASKSGSRRASAAATAASPATMSRSGGRSSRPSDCAACNGALINLHNASSRAQKDLWAACRKNIGCTTHNARGDRAASLCTKVDAHGKLIESPQDACKLWPTPSCFRGAPLVC